VAPGECWYRVHHNSTIQVQQQALETAQANMDRMSENGTLIFNETLPM
jgi:hypothetical protein